MTALRVALISAGEIYGGVERFIATYTKYLTGSGAAEPVVVLFSEGPLAKELRAAGQAVEIPAASGKYDVGLVDRLATFLREKNISVVHAHGYKAGVIGGLAARKAGIPAIKTEHGALEPFAGLSALKMRLNLFIDGLLTRRLFAETVYITQDLRAARRLEGKRGSRVIANGMAPLERGSSVERRLRDEFHVGIVGRLAPIKGHDVLFDALGRLKNLRRIRLHVFGTGPLETELRAKAATFGAETVVFHGFVTDMLTAMAGLDCLVMPSRNEGLPYTLLEAMHLGLPIVASNVGGMREILVDNKTAVLVPAGDAAALAAALDGLMLDAARRDALGAAAQADARERFGISAMAGSYLKLYSEVVK